MTTVRRASSCLFALLAVGCASPERLAEQGGDDGAAAGDVRADIAAGPDGSDAGSMSDDAAAGDGGSSGGGNDSSNAWWSPLCPPTPPADGSACDQSQAYMDCEYSDGGPWICGTIAHCNGDQFGTWILQTKPCWTSNPPGCPAAAPQSGSACDFDAGCSYPDGQKCQCGGMQVTAGLSFCYPGDMPGCSPRGRLGEACSTGAGSCPYDCMSYEYCDGRLAGATWQLQLLTGNGCLSGP